MDDLLKNQLGISKLNSLIWKIFQTYLYFSFNSKNRLDNILLSVENPAASSFTPEVNLTGA